MLHIVDTHDVARPLMLFYTPHVAHLPLQVPPSYLEKFAALTQGTDETLCSGFQAPTRPPVKGYVNPEGSPWSCRAQYHAAVNLLDDNIGDVVAAMRKRGMWDRTLMVFSSDNGGPVNVGKQASNNYPLCAAPLHYASMFSASGHSETRCTGAAESLDRWKAAFECRPLCRAGICRRLPEARRSMA